jgi:hypothetical protein
MATPDDCKAALAVLGAAADAADSKVGGVSGWVTEKWSSLIGADSAFQAEQADAAAERGLYNVMAAKLPDVIASGDPAVMDAYVAECRGQASTPALDASAAQLAPSAAVDQVVVQSVKDGVKLAADAAQGVGGPLVWLLQHTTLVLLAGAAAAAWFYWPRVRRARS